MISKIIGTVGSRVLNAFLSLGIILITSRQMGAEAVGTISLIILGITIIQMVNNFVGGSALIYLIPRFDVYKLFVPSYVWAFFTAIVCSLILKVFHLIPSEYFWHVMFLSLIQSLSSVNLTILLGKEKIKTYNIISSLQIVLLFILLFILVYCFGRNEISSYVVALYFSYTFGFVAGMIAALRLFQFTNLKNFKEVIRNILKFGTYVQLANIIQLFNYRLSYYFIENFIGRAALGVYSVGVQLSEGMWLAGKSLAIVQYSKISNISDREYSKKITLVFGKISVLVTFVLLLIILLIPANLFSQIFGKDFSDLPIVILSLSAGIVLLSLSFSFSHYFSGIGKHYHNSISSCIGFVFTAVLGYILIPKYKLAGAGITTSISYFFILVYQMIFFVKISGTKLKELLISIHDIRMFHSELKKWITKK
jgi:O-antigen/teichoic acid export membrane protein